MTKFFPIFSQKAFLFMALSGVLFLSSHTVFAQSHEPPVEDLLELPHPVHVLDTPEWSARLSREQKEQIGELRRGMQLNYRKLMTEALPLQVKLRTSVMEYGHAKALDLSDLQALAELRVLMTKRMAGAFARLQEILGEEAWQDLMAEMEQ